MSRISNLFLITLFTLTTQNSSFLKMFKWSRPKMTYLSNLMLIYALDPYLFKVSHFCGVKLVIWLAFIWQKKLNHQFKALNDHFIAPYLDIDYLYKKFESEISKIVDFFLLSNFWWSFFLFFKCNQNIDKLTPKIEQ